MSDRLLKESDVIEAFKGREPLIHDVYTAVAIIRSIPSADRPQGEWIDAGDYAICSNCGANSGVQYDGVEPVPLETRYCPHCGARMKGADDEVL